MDAVVMDIVATLAKVEHQLSDAQQDIARLARVGDLDTGMAGNAAERLDRVRRELRGAALVLLEASL